MYTKQLNCCERWLNLLFSIIVMTLESNEISTPAYIVVHITIPVIYIASPIAIMCAVSLGSTTFKFESSVLMMIAVIRLHAYVYLK